MCFILYMAFNILAEPLIEPQMGVKEGRHDEVEQSPQLRHAVLYWSAGQQQAVTTTEPQEQLPPLAVGGEGWRVLRGEG